MEGTRSNQPVGEQVVDHFGNLGDGFLDGFLPAPQDLFRDVVEVTSRTKVIEYLGHRFDDEPVHHAFGGLVVRSVEAIPQVLTAFVPIRPELDADAAILKQLSESIFG